MVNAVQGQLIFYSPDVVNTVLREYQNILDNAKPNFDAPDLIIQGTPKSNGKIDVSIQYNGASFGIVSGKLSCKPFGSLDDSYVSLAGTSAAFTTPEFATAGNKIITCSLYKNNGVLAATKTIQVKLTTPATQSKIGASATLLKVGETLQLWVENAYSNVKKVVINFGTAVNVWVAELGKYLGFTETTLDVKNGSTEKVGVIFDKPYNGSVKVSYQDANGVEVTNGQISIQVAASAPVNPASNPVVIPTVTITAAKPDSISGQLSASLGSNQVVNIYDGSTRLDPAATVNGTTWTFTPHTPFAVGTHNLTARVDSSVDGTHLGAASAAYPLTVSLAPQAITFGAAPAIAVGATATLTATGGASGNPVVLTSTTPAVCTVSGKTVTALTAGTCNITGTQAGNNTYSAASNFLSFTIESAPLNCLASQVQQGNVCVTPISNTTQSQLVGTYRVTDPTRSIDVYYANMILNADGTFSIEEISPPDRITGNGTWKYVVGTQEFSMKPNSSSGYVKGIITGNTSAFTLPGKDGDGVARTYVFNRLP